MIAIPATAITLLSRWWKLGVGVVIGALLCFPLAQCSGIKIGENRAALRLAEANTRYLQQKARADDLAAEQRLTDTIAVNRQEEDLRNAIASIPDSAPDATRIALGCERLRRAGQDTSRLPACS